MILTEKEASTRRCQEGFAPPHSNTCNAPMATTFPSPNSHYYGAAGGFGVTTQTYSPFNCIGSQCMAWRWLTDGIAAAYETQELPHGMVPGPDWEIDGEPFSHLPSLNGSPAPPLFQKWRLKTADEVAATGYCGKVGRL